MSAPSHHARDVPQRWVLALQRHAGGEYSAHPRRDGVGLKPPLRELHIWDGQRVPLLGGRSPRHARELADKFEVRFREITEAGRGRDWAYAGWYVEMLGVAERGDLPVSYADWYDTPDSRWLPTTAGCGSGLPMPPPGVVDGTEKQS
jgi:hypothetical protein